MIYVHQCFANQEVLTITLEMVRSKASSLIEGK